MFICWTVMLSTNTKVIGSKLNVCNTINDTCLIVFKRIFKRFFFRSFYFPSFLKKTLYISCLFVMLIPISREVFIATHSSFFLKGGRVTFVLFDVNHISINASLLILGGGVKRCSQIKYMNRYRPKFFLQKKPPENWTINFSSLTKMQMQSDVKNTTARLLRFCKNVVIICFYEKIVCIHSITSLTKSLFLNILS